MSERLAWPFTPEVAYMYNGGSAAIGYGEWVALGGSAGAATTYAVEYPETDPAGGSRRVYGTQSSRTWGTTMRIPVVVRNVLVNSASLSCFGVAMEDIAVTSWGHICLRGVCDVKIVTAMTVGLGAPLLAATSAQWVTAVAASAASAGCALVKAMALETVNTTACGCGFIQALFLPGEDYSTFAYCTG